MSAAPIEFTLELFPRARVDVIDVRGEVFSRYGDALDVFPRALCCSFHTTAGYLDQSVAARLNQGPAGVMPYIDVFRTIFPEGAGYAHDKIERRTELSAAQRPVEPHNADSHLAVMAGALRTCVAYLNRPGEPVSFIDLDGVHNGRPRTRHTSVLGYSAEEPVAQARVIVPVSGHSVESINLKDPRLGVYEQCADLVTRYGVTKGRIRLALACGERHAGLTVNEYETLLMRHDLSEVLRDPVRFMAEKAGHMLGNPRAIPAKTLDYAKYQSRPRVQPPRRRPRAPRIARRNRAVESDRHAGLAFLSNEAVGEPARLRPRFLRPRQDHRGHVPEPHPGAVAPRGQAVARPRRHADQVRLNRSPLPASRFPLPASCFPLPSPEVSVFSAFVRCEQEITRPGVILVFKNGVWGLGPFLISGSCDSPFCRRSGDQEI